MLCQNNFGIMPFNEYNDIQEMLVSSLILPWKQAISTFLKDDISEKIEKRFSFYDDFIYTEEDYAKLILDLPSSYVEKLIKHYLQPKLRVSLNEVCGAYYQFNRILEAKRTLVPKELDTEEYREFERILARYI